MSTSSLARTAGIIGIMAGVLAGCGQSDADPRTQPVPVGWWEDVALPVIVQADTFEHLEDLRPRVRRPFRRAQRDVQHRAILGHVDVLAGEHRVDPLAHAPLLG